MKPILFCLFSYCFAILACTASKNTQLKKTQGIDGYVQQISGNQMPMKGRKPAAPKGIVARVLVYEKTNTAQTVQIPNTPLYSAINTKFIAAVTSDTTGHFTVHLPVGSYSLFVQQGNLFFANSFDANNNISVVTIETNKVTPATLVINTSATY